MQQESKNESNRLKSFYDCFVIEIKIIEFDQTQSYVVIEQIGESQLFEMLVVVPLSNTVVCTVL